MAFNNSTLHVNVPLTDLANRFTPEMEGYLWSRLLPPKVVTKRSDLIRQIDKGNLLRLYDLRAGAAARVQEVQFKVNSSLTFNAIDYSVQTILRNTDRMEADEILQYDQEQMYTALVSMHTNLEYVTIKQTLRDTALLTKNVTLLPAEYWDNRFSIDSDPIADLLTAVNSVFIETTKMPNLIVFHTYVWRAIQQNARVLARAPVHPTGSGILTLAAMEEILGVDPGTICVTAQQYTVNKEGSTADDTFTSMIGPDTIVAYVAPASQRAYSLGNSFMFQDASAGGDPQIIKEIEAPFVVYEFPDNGMFDVRGATVHRLVGGLDQKVLVPGAGYLIKNCVDYSNQALYGTSMLY